MQGSAVNPGDEVDQDDADAERGASLERLNTLFGRLIKALLIGFGLMVVAAVALTIAGKSDWVGQVLTVGVLVILVGIGLFLIVALAALRKHLASDGTFQDAKTLEAPDLFTLLVFCALVLAPLATPFGWLRDLTVAVAGLASVIILHRALGNVYAYARVIAIEMGSGWKSILDSLATPSSLLAVMVAQDPLADALQLDGHMWSGFARLGLLVTSVGVLAGLGWSRSRGR